jgi:Ni/Co efflux regulator RcnB
MMHVANSPTSVFPGLLLALAMALGATSAFAEKPDGAGKPGKGEKHKKELRHDDRAPSRDRDGDRDQRASSNVSINVQIGGYFGEPQRVAARDYYAPRFKAGNCPPGLAKKNNGCLPPGQAKKWQMGRPLPRDVVYYPVPSGVSIHLGAPPSGHKYVRVAADILLIAIGTGLVVDAIEDLGRL